MISGVKRKVPTNADDFVIHKEWDEILCSICMDHPHNAVLLRCSSHEKGCRSYICDTSYRHSNCLDRFKELTAGCKCNHSVSTSSLPINSESSSIPSNSNLDLRERTDVPEVVENHNINESDTVRSVGFPRGSGENNIQNSDRHLEMQEEGNLEPDDSESSLERIDLEDVNSTDASESKLSLKCPLCRGAVLGWEVAEEAREYLNLKRRSCSRESCSFFGNYQELRRHARRVHPTVRPADIDPSREQAWRRLQHQRDYGDIVSAVRSAIPNAVVLGDYVIDTEDRLSGERENGVGEANGPLWSTFFLFQMIRPVDPASDPRRRSRAWTRHRRLSGALSARRRFLWGENLLGLQDNENDEDDDLNMLSDLGENASPIPRRRRRLTRSISDDD